jgi:type I restriction enzyme S subunit
MSEFWSSDWEQKQIGELCDVIDPHPSHRAPKEKPNGVYFLGIGDLSEDGEVIGGKARRVSPEVFEEHQGYYRITDNTIGFCRVASVGKVIQFKSRYPFKITISPTLAIIEPKGIDNKFLAFCLRSRGIADQVASLSSGSTRESLGIKTLRELTVPVPPLPEQKKIAEILSGIDTRRQALAKKVANASMLRNALGEKIFSSLDGKRVPLGELCNPKQWQTISTNQLTTSGYPVYGANGKIGYFTKYNHKEPVLAVTCRGATCGNLTLVPAFSYVTGNSMCLDNPREDTSPEYLFQFLSWRGLKDVISGSAQPQITRSPLQAVEVVLPSKERQDKIVSALESVNNAENIMSISLGRLDLLKQAMAADLLSGRKRVSV